MKKHLVSILRPIAVQVDMQLKTRVPLIEVKKYILVEVQKHTQMNPTDMQTIIKKTSECPTGVKLLQYLWDSLLKYEGDGVWQKQN